MEQPVTHLNSAVPFGVHVTGATGAECARAAAAYHAMIADPAAYRARAAGLH